jgi:hypothetical protein
MRAVADGFARLKPKILIVEGHPSAMGESPAVIAARARRYAAPGAGESTRSEMAYAVSLAVRHGIPFLGGEPTHATAIEAVKAAGANEDDLAFGNMAGLYSQALRSGDIPDLSFDSLSAYYPQIAAAFALPGLAGDTGFPQRIDVAFDNSRQGQFTKVASMVRDRHLLALIEQQLTARQSVLVVYGGSHWATLSAALETRLGKPTVKPFLR